MSSNTWQNLHTMVLLCCPIYETIWVQTLTYLGSSQPLAKLASKLSDLYSPSPTERKYKECLFGVHNTVETSLNSHLSWAVTSALRPCDNGLNRFPISLYRISLT